MRTCGIRHLQNDGKTIEWEASNLDCKYVEDYLKSNLVYPANDENKYALREVLNNESNKR